MLWCEAKSWRPIVRRPTVRLHLLDVPSLIGYFLTSFDFDARSSYRTGFLNMKAMIRVPPRSYFIKRLLGWSLDNCPIIRILSFTETYGVLAPVVWHFHVTFDTSSICMNRDSPQTI